MEPSRGHRRDLEGSGHSHGGTGALPPLGQLLVCGGGQCSTQKDFLLVSTVDSKVMRSQSLGVSKQGLAQGRAMGLES